MVDSPPTILVLGAGGVVGRSIVSGLLAETDFAVTATGRNAAKLQRVFASQERPRLSLAVLDALDSEGLARACQAADVVVNCVGPYIISGREIAATVVRSRRHYVDFAFEQFHFHKLTELDGLARANGVALVTGAGEVVGMSSVLCAHLVERLPEVERLTVIALEAGTHDAVSGFASRMNGVLEPALGNQDYVDGRYATSRMGRDVVVRTFAQPHGRMTLVSDPSIDCLLLPRKYALRTVKNYFGMGTKIPPGFFPLMRLLNPYKNRIVYALAGRVVRRIMRGNHARKDRSGVPVAQLLRVEAESKDATMAIEFRFRNDFNCTAYLPILVCKRLARGAALPLGLNTALDIVSPAWFFAEMQAHRESGRLDWTIEGPKPR